MAGRCCTATWCGAPPRRPACGAVAARLARVHGCLLGAVFPKQRGRQGQERLPPHRSLAPRPCSHLEAVPLNLAPSHAMAACGRGARTQHSRWAVGQRACPAGIPSGWGRRGLGGQCTQHAAGPLPHQVALTALALGPGIGLQEGNEKHSPVGHGCPSMRQGRRAWRGCAAICAARCGLHPSCIHHAPGQLPMRGIAELHPQQEWQLFYSHTSPRHPAPTRQGCGRRSGPGWPTPVAGRPPPPAPQQRPAGRAGLAWGSCCWWARPPRRCHHGAPRRWRWAVPPCAAAPARHGRSCGCRALHRWLPSCLQTGGRARGASQWRSCAEESRAARLGLHGPLAGSAMIV